MDGFMDGLMKGGDEALMDGCPDSLKRHKTI